MQCSLQLQSVQQRWGPWSVYLRHFPEDDGRQVARLEDVFVLDVEHEMRARDGQHEHDERDRDRD